MKAILSTSSNKLRFGLNFKQTPGTFPYRSLPIGSNSLRILKDVCPLENDRINPPGVIKERLRFLGIAN